MSENSRRYPIEKHRYLQCVGKLFEHRIGQIFEELGFKTEIAKGQSNGVDLKVYDNEDNLILVAELVNWCPYSKPNIQRKDNVVSNLSQYHCKRFFIYTTMKGESILDDLRLHDVSLIKIGYQILPKYFYDFYARRNQVILRRIDSRETRQNIKSKIMDFLQTLNRADSPCILSNEVIVTNL